MATAEYEKSMTDYDSRLGIGMSTMLRTTYGTYGPGGKRTILTIVILQSELDLLRIERDWEPSEGKDESVFLYKEMIRRFKNLRDNRRAKWRDILDCYGC